MFARIVTITLTNMPTSNEERADWLLQEEERFLNEPAEELPEEEPIDEVVEESHSEKLTRLKEELLDEMNNPLQIWN